ncbi:hypothetical protein F5884DRAFT_856878 [Xylogone sp. PMI_703]|nr:hypothetical protein F5884DRAFT_856878 [Xylogone sp. PMI_703]
MRTLLLCIALLVLLVDSAIELAFISSMVGYLHRSGANQYPFNLDDGTSALINAKPKGLQVNQGHTSNGAAGTALVLICFGGALVLWLQRREDRKGGRRLSPLFVVYTVFTILSTLLTLSALAYTFAITNDTKGQSIDKNIAARFQSHAYPLDKWTPETWTKALLALPVTSSRDANYLRHWLRVMEGWKWNLIPMFIINICVSVASVAVCLERRGGEARVNPKERESFVTEHAPEE